jgi:hypothetical protein
MQLPRKLSPPSGRKPEFGSSEMLDFWRLPDLFDLSCFHFLLHCDRREREKAKGYSQTAIFHLQYVTRHTKNFLNLPDFLVSFFIMW